MNFHANIDSRNIAHEMLQLLGNKKKYMISRMMSFVFFLFSNPIFILRQQREEKICLALYALFSTPRSHIFHFQLNFEHFVWLFSLENVEHGETHNFHSTWLIWLYVCRWIYLCGKLILKFSRQQGRWTLHVNNHWLYEFTINRIARSHKHIVQWQLKVKVINHEKCKNCERKWKQEAEKKP